MAKSMVSTNAKEFLEKLDKKTEQYHAAIVRGIAEFFEDIRFQAIENIIPRSVETEKFSRYALYRLWKLQPPTPGKITERTGKLIEVLGSGGYGLKNWKVGKKKVKTAKLKVPTKHLYGIIRPQSQGGRIWYEGILRLREKGEVRNMKGRIIQEKKGRRFLITAFNQSKRKIESKMFKKLNKAMNEVL